MAKPALKPVSDALVSVVLVAAAVTVIYGNAISDGTITTITLEVPSEPLSLDGAAIRGSDRAEAVMIVFADFQCPFCARFAREVLPEIERRYVIDGRVAVAFRHLPLPSHPQAAQAAMVAECADRQGRFWDAHDRLFAATSLNEEALKALPASLGLDQPVFDECLLDRSVSEKVTTSAKQAGALGVRSTPTFFIGRRLADGRVEVDTALSGSRPLEDYVRQLDATLDQEGPFNRLMKFLRIR